jgi:hypothetical protein
MNKLSCIGQGTNVLRSTEVRPSMHCYKSKHEWGVYNTVGWGAKVMKYCRANCQGFTL